MKREKYDSPKSVRRRLEVQQALSQYPDLPSDKIQDLVRWFKKEATAMEVAVVASQLDKQDSYRDFRRTHIDKLSPIEMIGATLVIMLLIVLVAVSAAVA